MSKDNGHFFPNLEGAAIGRPITRAGISFFPVYLMDNGLPEITTGPTADRVIDELNDASVPDLTVTNPGEFPLLLIEGEQFIGGKQNRTVNISVLVAAGATLEIPVSCLEAGRWGRQLDFQAAATNTPRRVRRTIHDAVAAQAGTASARRGAQGEVWAGIDASLHEMRMSSPPGGGSAGNCGHCGRRQGFHSRPGPGSGGGRAGAARPATRTVRVCGDPRSPDRRDRDFRRPRTVAASLAGARSLVSAGRAVRHRAAVIRSGAACPAEHWRRELQEVARSGTRRGTALHE